MARGTRHQLRCTVCNLQFTACRSDTLYCSDACSQQASRQRQAARALPAATSGLEVREWHGTPIQRREADGYVNATAMCQAGGRRWNHYATNDRTSEYLQALSGSAGIPADLLVQSITTGPNHQRGTWVHPRLAVDLARWISPAFAVWMDGWFLESIAAAPTPHHHKTTTVEPGITIRAKTPEQARILWCDAVWRHMVKAQRGDTSDVFHYVPV